MFLDPKEEVLDSKKISDWYILKKYLSLSISTCETSRKEGQDRKKTGHTTPTQQNRARGIS